MSDDRAAKRSPFRRSAGAEAVEAKELNSDRKMVGGGRPQPVASTTDARSFEPPIPVLSSASAREDHR